MEASGEVGDGSPCGVDGPPIPRTDLSVLREALESALNRHTTCDPVPQALMIGWIRIPDRGVNKSTG
jgi:hypothetical protein